MRLKRALLLLFSFLLLGFAAFIPKADDPLDRLVASLKQWSDNNPQEKVYLHMDKPYYALGDTIWFKGYVTVGSRHHLSALSGSLYVELINEKDSVLRTLKLPVTAGMAMGDFTLEDELKEGNYRIRAYTQWMRNAGDEYFFDRTFLVGKPEYEAIIAKAVYSYEAVNNKPVLTANLSFIDNEGKQLQAKEVSYEVFIDRKRAWGKSGKTDDKGNLSINFTNDKQADLRGAYIRAIIEIDKGVKITKDFPIKAGFAKTDVQLFPESGNLVNGITSRVAFKAVGVDGLGVPLKGIITDEKNDEVIAFETLHAGMGSFLLKPESGKSYSAKLSFADGSVQTVPLPKALDDGYVLSVYQPNADSILVRVYASKNKIDQSAQTPLHVNFVAQSGGETVIASPVKITRASSSFWLEKKQFPSGIAQFTIFNAAGEPLNERIAFINSNDRMQLTLKTSKRSYRSRERVQVELEALAGTGKPTPGNFSITVIDESKVPVDESLESTIFSNLLLTSDLRGYVEAPNYYFSKETEEVSRALDNLMLTQGYRRFAWKDLSNPNLAKKEPQFKAEGLGMSISGKVLSLTGKVVPNATVLMMVAKSGGIKNDTTDINGRFKFDNIFLTDSVAFSIQARLGKSNKLEIIIDSIPKVLVSKNKNIPDVKTDVNQNIQEYVATGVKQEELLSKMGMINRTQRLKEVVIRAKKAKTEMYTIQGAYRIPDGHSDQEYLIENAETCASLLICLQGRLQGVNFRASGSVLNYPFSRTDAMDVFLDGRLLDEDEISTIFDGNSIDATDIGKIAVIRTNLALMNMLTGKPAILIYTKRGAVRRTYNPSIANIKPKGFNKAREFYAPRYDRAGSNRMLPDLRSTIHWDPAVKTFSTGKTTIDYFNSDGPATYKIIVEGISADGELGRTVYRYQVEQGNPAVMATTDPKTPGKPLPDEDANVLGIRKALDTTGKKLPVEKLYVHTDKPYYNIGDTLWFKSYIMDGNLNPSKQSGLLYVELNSDSAEAVRRISIPIKDGIAWAQIPLERKIFQPGSYTLRAYTNWMQNFGEDYFFTKRFYLGIPASDTWLVNSQSNVAKVNNADQLNVDLKLKRTDKTAVALRDVEVTIYEDRHYLYKEKLQTDMEGNLKFSKALKAKADGRNLRVEIRSLQESDGRQFLQVPLTVNRNQNIDLQFLPEGGHLVAGLKSTVGFKALAEDGHGISVSGVIIDKTGAEQATFKTLYNGMGAFDFTPKTGQLYTAVLKDVAGNEKSYNLPKVEPFGTVMHIINDENSETIVADILASPNAITTDSAFYLIATMNDKLYFSKKIESAQDDIQIDKSLFPTGITKLTLLKGNRPLNERIFYIDHKDQLKVNIINDKPGYLNRENVDLIVEVKDKNGMPVKGNFSLSVTDDSQVKPDSIGNYNINTGLLLNSALKGKVENPGYYLQRNEPAAWQALDNLMLTQGWTGYSWAQVFNNPAPKHIAEKDFKITGKVVSMLNKPVPNAPVLISSQKPSFINTTLTDQYGKFTFAKLPQIDSGSFFFQAQTAKGKTKTFGAIEIDRVMFPSVPETYRNPVLPWYVNTDTTQVNYVKRIAEKNNEASLRQGGIALKEVSIQSKKIIKGSFLRSGGGNSDLAFDEKDIKESAVMNLYQILKQKLPGLRIVVDEGETAVLYNDYLVAIGIDGGELPIYAPVGFPITVEQLIDQMSQFQIASIIGIEVVYSRKFMTRYVRRSISGPDQYIGGFVGTNDHDYLRRRASGPNKKERLHAFIEITTKDGKGWHINDNANAVTYRPLPVMHPQEFYSPKYTATSNVAEPDYRSTLYWSPNIYTDASGRAKISFHTSDVVGAYNVNVQGTGTNGGLGSANGKIKTKNL